MKKIEVIDDEKLEEAQKRLVIPRAKSHLRGSPEQRKFVESVANDTEAFCKQLQSWITQRGDPPKLLPRKLEYTEYRDPPYKTEVEIAQTWDYLSPSQASRPGTWARISLELVKKDLVESHYFVIGGSSKYNGRDKIEQILNENNENNPDEIDKCVRGIFRNLGGLTGPRGKRTTFIDCPLAKCWWRHRIACQAHKCFPEIDVKEYSDCLRRPSMWQELIESMVSRLTVIGDDNIRLAVIRYLVENGNISKLRGKALKLHVDELLQAIGRRSTTQALGFFEPSEILEMIKIEIFPPQRKFFTTK